MMKKKLAVIRLPLPLLLLGVLVCLHTSPALGEGYLSIAELKAQTPARWQQTYEAHGRIIQINVPIYVPDVEKMPVLAGENTWPVFLDDMESYFDTWRNDNYPYHFGKSSALPLQDLADSSASPQDLAVSPASSQAPAISSASPQDPAPTSAPTAAPTPAKQKQRWLEHYLDTEKLDWNESHAEGNPLTLQEGWDITVQAVAQALGQDIADGLFLDRAVARGTYTYTDKAGGVYHKTDRASRYVFQCAQSLEGIPVLAPAFRAFSAYTGRTLTGEKGVMWSSFLTAHITSAEEFQIYLVATKATETLHQDVPLSSFAPVQSKLEEMILAGQIRAIYTLRLGYVYFMKADGSKKGFDFFPCWVVECDFAKKPKQETEDPLRPDIKGPFSYTLASRFTYFLFNAQTGELIDPKSVSQKRSRCPEVITWESVR